MDLTAYDNALKDKLKSVFDNVVNASEDKALEYSEDKKAEVKLPLISYWRLTNNIDPTGNFNHRVGRTLGTLNNATNIKLRELDVQITYQVDIWSDRRYEVDSILKELLFFFVDEPSILVKEENFEKPFSFPIRVTDATSDIDLSSFADKGNLYRQIITLEIDNAVLTSPTSVKIAKTIPIRIVTLEGDDL